VRVVSVVFLVLLGCAAAEVSQITGALLVFALLVMPAAAAQQLTARPALSFALTIAFGLLVAWFGLGFAYFSIYPVGFFVTTVGFGIYLLAVVTRIASAQVGRRARSARVVVG
jgi:zinc/manganese transport system permease protein